jgi:uncharacterized protein DUF3854
MAANLNEYVKRYARLSDVHTNRLKERGISPEIARERGYRTEEVKANLRRMGFSAPQCNTPALVIPLYLGSKCVTHQIRPDNPRTDRNGKTVKYELAYRGRVVLDAHPLLAKPRKEIGPTYLENELPPLIADPTVPLVVTEGVLKADSATSRGLCCLSLLGVYGFRGTNSRGGKVALPEWENIALDGRDVYIAYDSDAMQKPQVHQALRRLKGFLESKGARVLIVLLPCGINGQKVGLDDWIAARLQQGLSDEQIRHALLALATEELRELPRDKEAETRPGIVVNAGQLRDRVGEALSALRRANNPPTLFTRAGVLARLRSQEHGPELAPLDTAGLLAELSEAANFYRKNRQDELEDSDPPDKVIKAILGSRTYPFPALRAIVRSPFFAQEGELVATPGYHSSAQIYLSLDDQLAAQIPYVPDRPAEAEVAGALAIIDDLLFDFPFADPASKAHAIALMLLPFVRELINGPTPIHAINAPIEGTGKGKLITTLCAPALGRISAMSELTDQEEMRKRLTSIVLGGTPVAWFDNINREIRSGELAAMLTTESWEDRILGQSKLIRVPVRTAWIVAGNNLRCSGEIVRRSVEIRLDAKVPDPSSRRGFRHELPVWAFENRARLIYGCLVLVRNWIANGRQAFEKPFGSFEAWTRVIGGILHAAGIPALLENRQEFSSTANQEVEICNRFVAAWWMEHRDAAVTAKALLPLAEDVIAQNGDEHARTVRLGKTLEKYATRTLQVEDSNGAIFVQIARAEVVRDRGRKSRGYKLCKSPPRQSSEPAMGTIGKTANQAKDPAKNRTLPVPESEPTNPASEEHYREAETPEYKGISTAPDNPDSDSPVSLDQNHELEPDEELL